MATIEERACNYIRQRLEFVDNDKDCVKYWAKTRDIFIEFYSIGATEQQKIDIEWLEDNAIHYVGEGGITNWKKLFEDIRNAMEE